MGQSEVVQPDAPVAWSSSLALPLIGKVSATMPSRLFSRKLPIRYGILRCFCYRLLMGEQGPRLRQITSIGHHGYQIARAIDWLKENFSKPVKIEELAGKAGLSVSAFHNHFRSITAMSPLQYQKRMRLNEARHLMLANHLDASRAAFEVGYRALPSSVGNTVVCSARHRCETSRTWSRILQSSDSN